MAEVSVSRKSLRFSRALLVATVAALLGLCAAQAVASSVPRGAIRFRTTGIKKHGGVVCGKVHGRWQPGTILRKRYFISDLQQSRNFAADAKRAKGAQRKHLIARSRSFAARARKHRGLCPNPRTPAQTPSAPATPGAGTTPTPTTATSPLRMNFSGAVGVALLSSTTQARSASRPTAAAAAVVPGSNLRAVDAGGQLTDAVTSGKATIKRILVAPNNKLYVVFQTPTNLADTSSQLGTKCLLAEVDRTTGEPTCIDASLSSIRWPFRPSDNPPLQFDNAGAIYYAGSLSDGRTVLRRFSNGVITDLITDNVTLEDFLVRPDGSVFVTGSTTSTNTYWTRRISPSGSIQSLKSVRAQFLRGFPDGNVYMGFWDGSDFGVERYVTASNVVEPKYWISSPGFNGMASESYNDASAFCSGNDANTNQGFCGTFGSIISGTFTTSDGDVFVAAGDQSRAQLVQYYPTVAMPATAVKKVHVALGIITNVVLAGLNASDQNILTLYNASTGAETELIGPGNEIEIYHLDYSAATNRIMFDGLRFSDNTYVLGQVDVSTHEVTASPAGTSKWSDFQVFG